MARAKKVEEVVEDSVVLEEVQEVEIPNVNRLNGVPNFGYGLPQDGVVVAGVTDTPEAVEEPTQEPTQVDEVSVDEVVPTSETETI